MSNLSPYFIERNPVGVTPALAALKFAERPGEAGIGLADCWKIIKARWRMIGALVVAAVSLTGLIVFTMTPRYLATSTLLIDPEPPHLMDVASLLERMQSHDEDDYAKTQYALLSSDELVAGVIRSLDLEKNPLFATPPGRLQSLISKLIASRAKRRTDRLGVSTAAIDDYLSHLRIMPDNGTRLVKVSFDSPSSELAARIVNTHVQSYLLLNGKIQGQSGEAARTFLEKELVRIKTRVEKSEATLNDYRDRKGILSFGDKDQEKNEVAEQTMEDLEKALTDAKDQRIKAQSEMELVNSGDYDSLPAVVDNLMIQNLKPDVDHLQAQYVEMAAKYTDVYPPLTEVKAKLAEERRRLSKEMEAIARATRRRYAAALSREKNLERKVAEERRSDFARNDISLQDAVLAREVEANREIYEAVLKRMQEIGVNGAAPVSNIGLVESAIPPPLPSLPQKVKSLAIAGLSSALLGIALTFAFDQVDDRFKSADEMESYLNLPELGILPDFEKLPGRRAELAVSDGLSLVCGSEQVTRDPLEAPRRDRAFEMLEAYNGIRTALLYSRAGAPPKTILFVSALPEEGKSTTASGMALAFAQTGARTLLIDADLRKPHCQSIFGTDNSIGLSEVLVGRAAAERAIQRVDSWPTQEYKGVFLLSAGANVPNPGELLTSVRMFELARAFASDFDFVLLDSSPVVSANETIGLATMVDSVVVVAAVKTPKQAVRATCRRLSNAGAKVLGVVVNRVDLRRASFSDFTRHYGQYWRYGNGSRRTIESMLRTAFPATKEHHGSAPQELNANSPHQKAEGLS